MASSAPVKVEQRPAQVDQGDALAVPVADLPVQVQGTPQQVKSLIRPP